MKKVISGEELIEKMQEAVHLMCNTVKTTLGPKGKNVIIDHSLFQPFITNDGVTIAENIESEDEILQTILTLTKESSINTNNQVGDGTTTTLVLLQTIFDQGIEQIKNGINPMILKRELEQSVKMIIEEIFSYSRKPTRAELQNIATISANDKEIGKIISTAYSKVKSRTGIELIEQEKEFDEMILKKGYMISTIIPSPYFLKKLAEEKLKDSYILLIQNSLAEIENLYKIINHIITEKKNLVILAEDFDDRITEEILNIKEETNCQIYLLKNPEYGLKSFDIFQDLQAISNATLIKKMEQISFESLGIIKNITINEKNVTFFSEKNNTIKKRKKEILTGLKKSETDLEISWNKTRLDMFQNGRIEILIGAPTKTEARERKMRFEDALWAIDIANHGILPGSGIVLLEISEKMNQTSIGNTILKSALQKPFFQILENAGINAEIIYQQVKKDHFKKLYNLSTDQYENKELTGVLDATLVVIEALKNAVSIASMLLTTNHLIVNEYQNDLAKENTLEEL